MAYSQQFPLSQPQQRNQQPTFGPDLAVRLICPNCRDPNPNIIEEFSSGDLVCGTCGLVLGDRVVDTRSEWRVSTVSFINATIRYTRMDVLDPSFMKVTRLIYPTS